MFENISRQGSDWRRFILAVIAVLAMIAVSCTVVCSDASDAADADSKTYYKQSLTAIQKKMYEGMDEMTIENPSYKYTYSGVVDENTVNTDVKTVYEAYVNDNPLKYWIGKSWSTKTIPGEKTEIEVTITDLVTDYGNTKEAVAQTLTKIEKTIDSITVRTDTRYNALTDIHQGIATLLSYDNTMPDGSGPRNVATAFVGTHSVVCEGYAKAFKAMCDYKGIPCILVSGIGKTTDNPEGGPHMWNEVQMENGKWYLVDCTWDDQASLRTTYFLAGTDSDGYSMKVGADHVADAEKVSKFNLPAISTNGYTGEEYTITFRAHGTVVSTSKYLLKDKVNLPADPSGSKTATSKEIFKGWSTDGINVITIPTVTASTEYIAVFESVPREYTAIFTNDDGSELARDSYGYTQNIVAPAASPVKAETEYTTYVFSKWKDYKEGMTPAYYSFDSNDTITFKPEFTEAKNIKEKSGSFTLKVDGDVVTLDNSDVTRLGTVTGSFTISFKTGTIILDKTATTNIKPGQSFSITEKKISSVDSSIRSSLKNANIYLVDLGTDDFKGSATVQIPFKLGTLEKSDNIKTYYVNENAMSQIDSFYANGDVGFDVTKTGIYAVQIEEDTVTSLLTRIESNPIILAILLFAIIGMLIAYKFS